jgi:terminase small subunit-like protein
VSTQNRRRRERHSYSPEVADLICESIAVDGLALRQICEDASMPARSTVFLWLRQRPDFRKEYTSAKWLQFQFLADDMIDIADGRTKEAIEPEEPDGTKVRVFDPEDFRRRKKQVGALHWRLSKLRPKRYHW